MTVAIAAPATSICPANSASILMAPAKWIAKLRELKNDKNILVMHTDMESGHGGASGRFDALKEVARDYSFLLDLEGYIEN